MTTDQSQKSLRFYLAGTSLTPDQKRSLVETVRAHAPPSIKVEPPPSLRVP